MAIYSIYRFTNLVNGKVYIGKTTKDPQLRYDRHLNSAKCGSQQAIHRAIRKYGNDAFKFEVIFTVFDKEDLNQYEKHFITENQSHSVEYPHKGYNMTKGGDGIDSDSGSYFNKLRILAGEHNWTKPEHSQHNREQNLKRVADGTHHFIGPEFQKRRVEAGLHPWAGERGSEHNREKSRREIAEGRHNFGSEFSSYHNKRRVEEGTHNFQGELGSKQASARNRKQVEQGTHVFLKLHKEKHPCPHCGREFTISHLSRWHGDNCKIKLEQEQHENNITNKGPSQR